jgi:hypothetical protein
VSVLLRRSWVRLEFPGRRIRVGVRVMVKVRVICPCPRLIYEDKGEEKDRDSNYD